MEVGSSGYDHRQILLSGVGQILKKIHIMSHDSNQEHFENSEKVSGSFVSSCMTSALKSCLRHCSHKTGFHIVEYLESKFQDRIHDTALKAASNQESSVETACQDFCSDEVCLLYTLHLLDLGKFEQALSHLTEEKVLRVKENNAPAVMVLLSGYKTLLTCFYSKTGDVESVATFLCALRNAYLELFADASVYMLVKLERVGEAEQLLFQMADWEDTGTPDVKSAPPILAYEICKNRIPNASLKLTLHLLEKIASFDPANILVLELCRKYLLLDLTPPTRSRNQSDTESHCEFDADEAVCSVAPRDQTDYLSRCLELVMLYVDELSPSPTSLTTGEVQGAWEILSETMRRICERGSDECISKLVQLWHKGRKAWWPYQHFRNPAHVRSSAEAVLLSNKAVACFLLESESHPFVISRKQTSSALGCLIEQMRLEKTSFDVRILAALETASPNLSKNLPPSQEPPPIPDSFPAQNGTPDQASLLSIETSHFQIPSTACRASEDRPSLPEPSSFCSDMSCSLMSDSEDEAVQRVINAQQGCSFNTSTQSDRSDDILYEPDPPLEVIEKPFRPWSERLRSSGNHPDDGNEDLQNEEGESQVSIAEGSLFSRVEIDCSKKIDRWKNFIATANWDELSEDFADSTEDLSSDFTSLSSCSSEDATVYAKISDDASPMEERTDEGNCQLVSQSSQQELTPAFSSSSGLTPRLQFSGVPAYAREVIPNPEPYRYFDLNETDYSVCSSTTEDIAHTLSQVVKKLAGTCDGTENRCETLEGPVDEDCVVEAVIAGDELTTLSKNCSGRCDTPSPDMFHTLSSDAEDGDCGRKVIETTVEVHSTASGMKVNRNQLFGPITSQLNLLLQSNVPISKAKTDRQKALAEALTSSSNSRAVLENSPSRIPATPVITGSGMVEASSGQTTVQDARGPLSSSTPISKASSAHGMSRQVHRDGTVESQDTKRNEPDKKKKRTGKASKKKVTSIFSEIDRKNAELVEQLLLEASRGKTNAPKKKSKTSTNEIAGEAKQCMSTVHSGELEDSTSALCGTSDRKRGDNGKAGEKNGKAARRLHIVQSKPPRKAHIRVKNPEYWSDFDDSRDETLLEQTQVPSASRRKTALPASSNSSSADWVESCVNLSGSLNACRVAGSAPVLIRESRDQSASIHVPPLMYSGSIDESPFQPEEGIHTATNGIEVELLRKSPSTLGNGEKDKDITKKKLKTKDSSSSLDRKAKIKKKGLAKSSQKHRSTEKPTAFETSHVLSQIGAHSGAENSDRVLEPVKTSYHSSRRGDLDLPNSKEVAQTHSECSDSEVVEGKVHKLVDPKDKSAAKLPSKCALKHPPSSKKKDSSSSASASQHALNSSGDGVAESTQQMVEELLAMARTPLPAVPRAKKRSKDTNSKTDSVQKTAMTTFSDERDSTVIPKKKIKKKEKKNEHTDSKACSYFLDQQLDLINQLLAQAEAAESTAADTPTPNKTSPEPAKKQSTSKKSSKLKKKHHS